MLPPTILLQAMIMLNRHAQSIELIVGLILVSIPPAKPFFERLFLRQKSRNCNSSANCGSEDDYTTSCPSDIPINPASRNRQIHKEETSFDNIYQNMGSGCGRYLAEITTPKRCKTQEGIIVDGSIHPNVNIREERSSSRL